MWPISLLLVFLALSVKADNYGDWEFSIDNGEATITGYSGGGGAVEVPNSVNGFPVKTFGYPGPAFWITSVFYSKQVTSVIIPDGVTKIGQQAFQFCTNLTSLVLPSSLTSIGADAFAMCDKLTSVTVPSGVTSIGAGAFSYCFSLSSVYVPLRFRNNYTSFGLSSGQVKISLTPSELTVIESDSKNTGIAYVTNNPANYGLYTSVDFSNNFTTGQQSVLSSPNSYSLYTTNQIHNLSLGGIMLNRDANNQLVLNYQILQSSDLQNWLPYQQYELPITNAPSDKMFLRVQAVGQ